MEEENKAGNTKLKTQREKITNESCTQGKITTGIVQGTIDIAAVPCNLASVLYNKTEGAIQVAAINTLGVLYVVEKGERRKYKTTENKEAACGDRK